MKVALLFFNLMIISTTYSQRVDKLPIINVGFHYILNDESDLTYIIDDRRFDLFRSKEEKVSVELIRVIEKVTVANVITYFASVRVQEFFKGIKTSEKIKEMMVVENSSKGTYRIDFNDGHEWLSKLENRNESLDELNAVN